MSDCPRLLNSINIPGLPARSQTSNPARREEDILAHICAPLDDPRPLPHLLVVVSHPDDEVVAVGGSLSRYKDAVFVHVTDGAPLDEKDARRLGFASWQDYRDARQRELHSAYQLAGIPSVRDIRLQIPDQQAMRHLNTITRKIQSLLQSEHVDAVLTHPYEGGHPDHDSCAFAVSRAVMGIDEPFRPSVVEAAFYHAGPDGIETSCFLPSADDSTIVKRKPDEHEERLKWQLLSCFPSQRGILQYFGTRTEQFRLAPEYDFSRRPHAGKLFYEQFPWGITGDDFLRHVRDAECR